MDLSTPLKTLPGIGEKKAELFASAGFSCYQDLLNHIPRKYISHSMAIPIKSLESDAYVTIFGTVLTTGILHGKKKRFTLSISDGTGICKAVWFRFINQVEKRIKKGMKVALTGKVNYFSGYQIVHPEIEILSEDTQHVNEETFLPIYSVPDVLRKKHISSSQIKTYIGHILTRISTINIPEQLPSLVLKKHNFPTLIEAYRFVHQPTSETESVYGLSRFKFEELFYLQLYLLIRKRKVQHTQKGNTFSHVGPIFNALYKELPFELTSAQKRVIKEIRRDMKMDVPMNRLVQGDVGSGKTIVALLCLAIAVDNGFQTAFMAPTEILAEQHYLNLAKYADRCGLRITLLTGKLRKKQREERLLDIANGMVDIVVGTHAVIQDAVQFNKLGFVIIDEQHRFGVMQRASLLEKGENPDVLVMTATPIPRTLALTVYGDLDVSVINELPAGRKPIETRWYYDNREAEVYAFILSEIKQGSQVYIVFPLIEESEKMDLKAATDAYENLCSGVLSGVRVGLLHGRMKPQEKEDVMHAFKQHELDVLVSTTVIEVGVDVPNATIMLIENAERFGLTQLHQLRGRVGRGKKQSYCLLKTAYNLSSDGKERMEVMCSTNDGFRIAEEDLRIRGIGELFGTRQSGISDLRMANLATDQAWLLKAREAAEALLEDDPHIRKNEHKGLRSAVVLYAKRFGLIDIA